MQEGRQKQLCLEVLITLYKLSQTLMLWALLGTIVFVALPASLTKRGENDFKNKTKLETMITDHLRKAHLLTL